MSLAVLLVNGSLQIIIFTSMNKVRKIFTISFYLILHLPIICLAPDDDNRLHFCVISLVLVLFTRQAFAVLKESTWYSIHFVFSFAGFWVRSFEISLITLTEGCLQ